MQFSTKQVCKTTCAPHIESHKILVDHKVIKIFRGLCMYLIDICLTGVINCFCTYQSQTYHFSFVVVLGYFL